MPIPDGFRLYNFPRVPGVKNVYVPQPVNRQGFVWQNTQLRDAPWKRR